MESGNLDPKKSSNITSNNDFKRSFHSIFSPGMEAFSPFNPSRFQNDDVPSQPISPDPASELGIGTQESTLGEFAKSSHLQNTPDLNFSKIPFSSPASVMFQEHTLNTKPINQVTQTQSPSSILATSTTGNSPDSVTFASPQNSHWWYNTDLDNSQHGIQSEDALIQQTFHSDYISSTSSSSASLSTHIQNQYFKKPSNLQNVHTSMTHTSVIPSIQNQSLPEPTFSDPNPQHTFDGLPQTSLEPLDSQPPEEPHSRSIPQQTVTHSLPPARKKSPSIHEAAAMAAEIIAQESQGTHSSNPRYKKPRPCDSCRRRKVRCIMLPSDTGRCLHCEVKKQPCTFLEAPIRKPRSKKLIGKVTDSLQNASVVAAVAAAAINQVTTKLPKLKYEDYASLGGHTLLKKALSMQYPRSAYYIGPTSIHDQMLLEATPIDTQTDSRMVDDIELRKVSQDTVFMLHNDYSEELYTRSIHNCDAVEAIVSPFGQDLIDLYFKVVHPSFPIIHKKVFLEKYKRTHREFLAPLLAAVYLLALNWWDSDPKLSNIDPANKPDAEALLKLATSTFVDALDRPKLASIQAGLLLLQCKPTRAGNWMLCSQVVAIAEELALSVDCGRWKIPRWERGIRRRLSWAVWLQDQWLSLSESRPSHTDRHRTWLLNDLNSDDFPDKNENSDEDGGWAAEVANGRLLFCEMIELTKIVEDIRNQLFAPLAIKNITTTQEILEMAKPLQLRLRNWYHSLPKSLFMSAEPVDEANAKSASSQSVSESSESRVGKLSANGYLHLAYFASEITLHRRIIRSLDPSSSPPILIHLCRQAAKTRLVASINFVTNLQPHHVCAFWYSSSYSNFSLIGSFAGLLYVTSESEEEKEFYKTQLRRYKDVLKKGALQIGIKTETPGVSGSKDNHGGDSRKDSAGSNASFNIPYLSGFEPMKGALNMLEQVVWSVDGLWDDKPRDRSKVVVRDNDSLNKDCDSGQKSETKDKLKGENVTCVKSDDGQHLDIKPDFDGDMSGSFLFGQDQKDPGDDDIYDESDGIVDEKVDELYLTKKRGLIGKPKDGEGEIKRMRVV